MIVVGVTGKYCAGKSTVSDLLAEHSYEQIDVDQLGHRALEREREQIIGAFGAEVAAADGTVDRKALGRIVFEEEAQLRRLESIVHPAMVEMTSARVEEFRNAARPPVGVVINAAILFRMRLDPLCDLVLYVTAPFFQLFKRARRRDDASLLDVARRLRSQRDVDPQFSRSDADIHTVENNGDREKLRRQLAGLLPLP